MQTKQVETRRFLSRAEFSSATTISERALDNFIADGTVKAVRIGRRVLIPSSELQRIESAGNSCSLPNLRAVLAKHQQGDVHMNNHLLGAIRILDLFATGLVTGQRGQGIDFLIKHPELKVAVGQLFSAASKSLLDYQRSLATPEDHERYRALISSASADTRAFMTIGEQQQLDAIARLGE